MADIEDNRRKCNNASQRDDLLFPPKNTDTSLLVFLKSYSSNLIRLSGKNYEKSKNNHYKCMYAGGVSEEPINCFRKKSEGATY